MAICSDIQSRLLSKDCLKCILSFIHCMIQFKHHSSRQDIIVIQTSWLFAIWMIFVFASQIIPDAARFAVFHAQLCDLYHLNFLRLTIIQKWPFVQNTRISQRNIKTINFVWINLSYRLKVNIKCSRRTSSESRQKLSSALKDSFPGSDFWVYLGVN